MLQAAIGMLKELRALTADENGAQRLAWSPVWLKARAWFQAKLRELPVEHHLDAAGNSWTTLRRRFGSGSDSRQPSRFGSQRRLAGRLPWRNWRLCRAAPDCEEFDGRPPVTVRLVDWADEEGARFGRSLFGSSAFAGTHTH